MLAATHTSAKNHPNFVGMETVFPIGSDHLRRVAHDMGANNPLLRAYNFNNGTSS